MKVNKKNERIRERQRQKRMKNDDDGGRKDEEEEFQQRFDLRFEGGPRISPSGNQSKKE